MCVLRSVLRHLFTRSNTLFSATKHAKSEKVHVHNNVSPHIALIWIETKKQGNKIDAIVSICSSLCSAVWVQEGKVP